MVLTNKAPIHDRDGHIVGLVGIARDITECKEAGDALHKSEAHSRPLIRNVFDFIHADDVSSICAASLAVLARAAFTPTVNFRFKNCDGSWREASGTKLLADPAAGGGVNSYYISERKEIAGQLSTITRQGGCRTARCLWTALSRRFASADSSRLGCSFPVRTASRWSTTVPAMYADRPVTAESGGLASRLRRGDLLARFGVAEFTILPRKTINTSEVPGIAERLLPGNVCRFTLNGHTLPGSASLGAALSSPA